MTLKSGTRVGPYEIAALVGAGGMGEVYRARDTRLNRDVAVKVLPAVHSADAERLRRFEQEALAAGALNHPNILTVHDIGTHEGTPYIVSELLNGQTLHARLAEGRLASRKVIDYAAQIARGLAAAHEKQIVHRDLKPENLFITADDRIKILDFGLAKLRDSSIVEQSTAPTMDLQTGPGVVLGTVGYMSPEQVRGQEADHRSDIFSFGAILYEMLGGDRAFFGESAVETMNAILKEEPRELPANARQAAPALVRIMEHCLEKKPEHRFQSTRDLAFDLEILSGSTDTHTAIPTPVKELRRRRVGLMAVALTVLVGAVLLGVFVERQTSVGVVPTYRQLTFERGTIYHAWFGPQGDTVVYSASWNGNPPQVFSMRSDSLDARPLGLQNSDVLGISRSGDMAVLQNLKSPLPLWWFVYHGTLAHVGLAGGAPREIVADALEADFGPDGKTMAVTRFVDGRVRLEFPSGKVVYETSGWISSPRVSPSGDQVAFLDHQIKGDDRGWVAVVDRNRNMKRVSSEWAGSEGLAWRPDGKEIWFAAAKAGGNYQIHAVTLSGAERLVAGMPSNVTLHDIAADGRTLVSEAAAPWTSIMLPPGESRERDFSLLDYSGVYDLSDDGKTAIFVSGDEASGPNYTTYLRKTDGSPHVPLGQGNGFALSRDGKWVLAYLFTDKQLILIPTGPGEILRLDRGNIEEVTGGVWLPDGKRIIFIGREPGHNDRAYIRSIDNNERPRPITPENITSFRRRITISSDGEAVILRDPRGTPTIYPVDGGEPRPLLGVEPGDSVVRWGTNSQTLFVSRYGQSKIQIYRVDIPTGRRELFGEIPLSDPSGIIAEPTIFLTPDGKGYVYYLRRVFSKLYIATGLR